MGACGWQTAKIYGNPNIPADLIAGAAENEVFKLNRTIAPHTPTHM